MEVTTSIAGQHDRTNQMIDLYYGRILHVTGLDLHEHRREISPPGDEYYIIIRFIISVLLALCRIVTTKEYPGNTVINEYTIDGNFATMEVYHGIHVFNFSFGRMTTWTVNINVKDVVLRTETDAIFEFGDKLGILRFLKYHMSQRRRRTQRI